MKTKPNKFESGEQLISLWNDFCNEIIDNGFDKVPTQTAFCRWLAENYEETDRKTIYNSLNKIFPTIKKDFEKLQSDTITTGGMLGKYNRQANLQFLYVLHFYFGFGQKRLQQAVDKLFEMQKDLDYRYELPEDDTPFLCELKLKESGIDIDKLFGGTNE